MAKPSPLVAVEVAAVPPAPVAGDFIGFFMETQKKTKSFFIQNKKVPHFLIILSFFKIKR